MELKLVRKWKKDNYTIGVLSIDGQYECEVLEDKDRGLDNAMSPEEITRLKQHGRTAIPRGRYKVIFSPSPKFGKCSYAIESKIPLLLGVKGFSSIRMHAGNTDGDTEGCLLLGENKAKGMVLNSAKTCARVFRKMWLAHRYGAAIWITIE
ncbi:MAG: hypothetical protein IKZ67_01475 [Paludibacteraceae bacterium]|nr:hypothetical protein [Paludibacteraceae bacterium]